MSGKLERLEAKKQKKKQRKNELKRTNIFYANYIFVILAFQRDKNIFNTLFFVRCFRSRNEIGKKIRIVPEIIKY